MIPILDIIPVSEPPLIFCHVRHVKKEGHVLTALVTKLEISVHDRKYVI